VKVKYLWLRSTTIWREQCTYFILEVLENQCRKKQNNLVIHEEVQLLDAEKYKYSTRAVHLLNIWSTRKPRKSKCTKKYNPVIREEVQMLDTDKYNHLTRAVQAVIIGSKRKPTKSKSRKNIKKSRHPWGSSNSWCGEVQPFNTSSTPA
jgi:hypothetical protein